MQIERQLQGTLNTVFTTLIRERGLVERILPFPAIEENRADITLKTTSGKPLFFIEIKDPTARDGRSVFDGAVLFREVERAQKIDVKYFGNCNFLACAFFDRDKLHEKVSVSEGFFTLSDINRLSVNYTPTKEIENKLRRIANFYLDRAVEIIEQRAITFSNLDELFIFKIRKLIEIYGQAISKKVWEKYKSDSVFERALSRYAQSQLWNKPTTFEEVENLTHIGILMLVSKLIFYKTYVDNQAWHRLHPMQVPEDIGTDSLEELIWRYFSEFKEITGNFELLIGERSDIIFKIPFVSNTAIELVKEVLAAGEHYNFGNIPFDIIGRIFEELIREDERHKLGQYFTPPHVIDLINAFAIRNSNSKVLDPSCGSGTFLVRAYERKKILTKEENKAARHEILLNEIYGNDISNYPAYLSMLNLAIRNTRKPSYPRIANKDFFSITEFAKIKLHNQHGESENRPFPKFDAIIGNPPYTRQEDIGTMQGTVGKPQIQALIKLECGFEPSQRTSIFAHFFYHAGIFLKQGGYLAYICQNSWLDTDYGIDLQRYLLNNYEIIAIMDSEVERFFPSASVNTTIVILKKQNDENLRNQNQVHFVWFTDTLANIIKYHKGVDSLQEFIEDTLKTIETKHFRINCISQKDLAKHTKWGQFLKAPQVYFDIIEKGKEVLVPLKELAEIKFGIKTGCNEFFILEDKTTLANTDFLKVTLNNTEQFTTIKQVRDAGLKLVQNGLHEFWLIEADCLKPILTSPKDVQTYLITSRMLSNKLILTDESKKSLRHEFPFLYSYIRHGEKQGINQRSTCASRKLWYNIGSRRIPAMSFNHIINDFGKTLKGKVFSSNNFYNIYPFEQTKTIWYLLNSTYCWLNQQLIMKTNLGDGAGRIETFQLADFLIPNINLEHLEIDLGETKNYKEELGNLSSLKTVNPERVKLDSAILQAIGFTNKKQRETTLLNLYRATFKLIDARLQKAQSLKGVKAQRSKIEVSLYVEQLKHLLTDGNYTAKSTLKFAKQLESVITEISSEKKLQKKIFDLYWKEKFGQTFNKKEVSDSEQVKLF